LRFAGPISEGRSFALFFVVVLQPGHPYPLGATYDGTGVNFSLFSSVAERVEVCLFDDSGQETRFELPCMTALRWHGYFPGLHPRQKYGFRLHGPWAPAAGVLCNPSKLILDPYAKSIHGTVQWHEAVFGHYFTEQPGTRNDLDSAPYVPRSVVIDPDFDWGDDKPLRIPWNMTVIYEMHVKGLTMRRPDVPVALRGTYSGLAHPAILGYLKNLGVTAIELMPVQQYVHDMHLLERGLSNYWGYNTIGYFSPHNEYVVDRSDPTAPVHEFKRMVKALHGAGLEVILDVVYGHTAEGNHLGPVLSFKAMDNAAYYRLEDENPFYYKDYTGTGNSLNIRHPHVLQLVMDSLRYWVLDMHVDGFRFDLATALARGCQEMDPSCAFFAAIQQDPVLSQVKLIAEPWDAADGGYQLGHFPALWSEWNGKFRDSVREYWRGDGSLPELLFRMSGSPDLYLLDRRSPSASINFVTCHDGLTLVDLVTYGDKHNLANGECNCDGDSQNRSWNCGVEGETSDARVNKLRARQKRNLLATLMLAQGVPMLLAGDEIGRTQEGNNNAYCQDNEISWLDWEQADDEMFAFVQNLIRLRREHAVFRNPAFTPTDGCWYRNDGECMTSDDWNTSWAKTVGMFLKGSDDHDPDGDFYIVFNAHTETVRFTIPKTLGRHWRVVIDTARCALNPFPRPKGTHFSAAPHSLLVLARIPS
jgi:isoamylase